ncbi:MAG TPA: glycerol kinase GlpK [Gaiellaceae bacterium]|nr:glycerol kinase GlpK [Gaiellaceae bacterium]
MCRPRAGPRRGGLPQSGQAALTILAVDQGTTGTTCLVVDDELRARGRGYCELAQHFPRPGWVEHDPEEIWATVQGAAEAAVRDAGVRAADLRGIAITNQRETTVLWERATGRPVAPAIVWQDRRTADRCRALPAELVRSRTGLVPDPYFSATKLEWLLARTDAQPSELAFGTVDAWLMWKLTAGRVHATDVTNASRTMLLDLDTLDWNEELLALFGVEPVLLPRLVASSEVVGEGELLGVTLPIAGIAGDQQASLAGHGCFERGEAKTTYGTGSFVLVHAGETRGGAPEGLLETAAAPHGYALEGAILVSGAAIQWLRDGLGIVDSAAETEALARAVASTDGVSFVPALAGLGSPWWDPSARGLITGITRGTTRAHLVRAALEAIAFQVADVVDTIPGGVRVMRADGGGSANAFLMQLQADVLGCRVEVAAERETTALGAAALAGLALGLWPGEPSVRELLAPGAVYEPRGDPAVLDEAREGWRRAVRRALLP